MEERDPVLEARLRAVFKSCCFGGHIHAFVSCDSTMERAHALARGGAGEGTLVFALRQLQGRGRLGRRWESPDGGAYFSLILKPMRPVAETPQLSLVAGLAAAEAIHEQLAGRVLPPAASRSARGTPSPSAFGGWVPVPLRAAGALPPASPAPSCSVSIRWPNDVLVDGKKVAGILTEGTSGSSAQRIADSVQEKTAFSGQRIADSRTYVIVGIGINVTTDPCDLPQTATSLQAALNSSYPLNAIRSTLDPIALSAELCSKFDGWYDIWTAQGFAPIRDALRPWLEGLGQFVRLTTPRETYEGQAMDVDESGRIRVRLDAGIVRAFEIGEVRLLR